MWRATINGILARKLRLVLTALAVVLGVMFVAGSFVLTDTLKPAFTKVFTDVTVGEADVIVRGSTGANTLSAATSVPAALVEQIKGVEGVAAVDGRVTGPAQLVTADGTIVAAEARNSRSVGFSWGRVDLLAGLELREGRKPERNGEVALDAATAHDRGIEVGDPVRVVGVGEAEDFEIVGIFGIGDEAGYSGATIAAFDTETAQRLFEKPDLYDVVFVAVEPGADPVKVRDRIASTIASYDVVTASELEERSADRVAQVFDDFNRVLLIFAAIGVIVGFVIILNTFSILVGQRLREFGLLRAMGATGGQIAVSVVIEAFVVGLVAAGLGILAGIGVARLLLAAFNLLAFRLPEVGLVIEWRTVWMSAAVGLAATLIAAVIPAWRAARIPPVLAMSETNPVAAPRSLRLRAVLGVALAVVGVTIAVVAVGSGMPERDVEQGVQYSMLGVVVAAVGVAWLSAVVARPLALVIGQRAAGWIMLVGAIGSAAAGIVYAASDPGGWRLVVGAAGILAAVGLVAAGRSLLGLPGRLARSNAARNPRRTGMTAVALMIGVSLVVVVTILAASIKGSIEVALDDNVQTDLVLTGSDLNGVSAGAVEVLRGLDEVAAVTSVRAARAILGDGEDADVVGMDAAVLSEVADPGLVAGGLDGMQRGGLVLSKRLAERLDVAVGDSVAVGARSGTQMLPVVAIFANELFGPSGPMEAIVDLPVADALFGRVNDSAVWATARPGLEIETAQAAVQAALAGPYPNVVVRTEAEYSAEQQHQIDQILGGFYALLALAVLIALLGIINTIFLSVYERTRELGLLRAVGMARPQVRTMIRGEGVIIAIIGAALGVVIGGFGGWVLASALRAEGLTEFVVPIDQVLVFLVLAAVAGVVTAILPAWRASNLDVLDAIAVEFFTTGTKRKVPHHHGGH